MASYNNTHGFEHFSSALAPTQYRVKHTHNNDVYTRIRQFQPERHSVNKTPTTIENLGFFHMWLTLVSDPHTKYGTKTCGDRNAARCKRNI